MKALKCNDGAVIESLLRQCSRGGASAAVATTSRASWTVTYRQHRALPQNFVSGRTSVDSVKLDSIAALRTTAPCSSTLAPKRVWLPDAHHSAGQIQD